jgi:hypothetical protein
MVSRLRSGKGYQNISAEWKVPKNTVASIILKWKKFGTTKILPRAGCPSNLSIQGRRALVREVTKNPVVTLTGAKYRVQSVHFVYIDEGKKICNPLILTSLLTSLPPTVPPYVKTFSRVVRTLDWRKDSPSNRTTTLRTKLRQRRSDFGTSL